MISSVIYKIVLLVFGILSPAYTSFKTVKSKKHSDYERLLLYWTVLGFLLAIEIVTDPVLGWLPAYYEFKFIFLIWLLNPSTDGFLVVYRNWIRPYLAHQERDIDETLVRLKLEGRQRALSMFYVLMNVILGSIMPVVQTMCNSSYRNEAYRGRKEVRYIKKPTSSHSTDTESETFIASRILSSSRYYTNKRNRSTSINDKKI